VLVIEPYLQQLVIDEAELFGRHPNAVLLLMWSSSRASRAYTDTMPITKRPL
jgi:hypothetical protein